MIGRAMHGAGAPIAKWSSMANQPSLTDFTVLVADDNADLLESLAQLLMLDLGCVVDTANDGEIAVQKALALRPDAVVLDISMPVLGGIEAARRIRAAHAANPPVLIALTGKAGVYDDLAAIDDCFDHAFAKPPDIPRLLALLRAEAGRTSQQREQARCFSLSELFTQAARQVIAAARLPNFAFDYRGADVVIDDSPVKFLCGLHRLMCAAVDMLESGFLIFSADVEPLNEHTCRIVFTAAGTGRLGSEEKIAEVLNRLQVHGDPSQAPGPAGSRRARATCPNTNAIIDVAFDAGDGVLFRCELAAQPVAAIDGDVPDAAGARAWVVDASGLDSAGLQRRLQRLGWAVTRLEHVGEVTQRLAKAENSTPPGLLVALESTSADLFALQALAPLLPPTTQLVYGARAGSPALAEATTLDVRACPFSLGDLVGFTSRLRPEARAFTGDTQPAPLMMGDRPLVLVVDDNEVNRIVAGGLVEALGYEAAMASDGLDAIEWCRHTPPHAVLMDLDMPVLRGIEATRRLRELQRSGAIAPFSIFACTAHVGMQIEEECRAAGMDGYLSKPLSFASLREELKRVATVR